MTLCDRYARFPLNPGTPCELRSDIVFFLTAASNLDPADSNQAPDLYSAALGESAEGFVAVLTRIATGEVTLLAPVIVGLRYRAEYKERIEDPAWIPLGAAQTASGAQVQFHDLPAAATAQRFYRVVREE